ncbi:hypothetical protein C7B77_13145 [Chamaesiphon polymorphus CCALA 037]|uniref:Uncharacterized protein n=1 Tax=Chamaesiphon polymorphus CCALA 037 TaxID=2107692 RepID=A0A2T1GEN0_9CYAN|nr:hypothetical protein C7B77_13145 [Chamaesiphon polymorphus CCALA 037]
MISSGGVHNECDLAQKLDPSDGDRLRSALSFFGDTFNFLLSTLSQTIFRLSLLKIECKAQT